MRQTITNNYLGLSALFLIGAVIPTRAWSGRLQCPDSTEGVHQREIVATSAPEVKVSASAKEDAARWSKVTHPLISKATNLAKAQRTAAIEEGIEQGCPSNLVYVAQLVPIPDKPSGCDRRIVTRNGDNGVLYVQAIATCKYAWTCCVGEESGKPSPVSYKLEGPLNPNPEKASAANPASTSKPSKKQAD